MDEARSHIHGVLEGVRVHLALIDMEDNLLALEYQSRCVIIDGRSRSNVHFKLEDELSASHLVRGTANTLFF